MPFGNKSTQKRDYARDVKRAWRSCNIDIAAWGVLCAAVAALLLWLCFAALPEMLLAYRTPCILSLLTAALLFAGGLLGAVGRRRALPRIAERSVYAVMLTAAQQKRIVRSLSSQSLLRHFGLYAAVLLPVGTLMGALYLATGDSSCLLALALVALVGFFLALAAQTLQAASYATKDGFCTLADCGIIMGEDVLAFSAARGDVWALVRFDDCYSLRFMGSGFAGMRRSTEFPLPCDGALSNASGGTDVDAVLCETLRLDGVLRVQGEYRPLRDEAVRALQQETAAPVYKSEGQADAPQQSEEQDVPVNEKSVVIAAAAMLALLAAAAVYGIWFKPAPKAPELPEVQQSAPQQSEQPPFSDELPVSAPYQGEDGAWYVTIGGEEMLLVNKQYKLPADFGGENAEAVAAMNRMIAAAEADGVEFYIVSGYRSYSLQSSLWDRKVAAEGEEQASIWVARPGTSEHQSGLAFDVDEVGNEGEALTRAFAETEAFSWLAAHAAQYGFILRYPEQGTWATGYGYEPWHYRYVGETLAPILVESGVTVEEFLGLAEAAQ
ncbi:MAG: M15 family metallopeptidase [Oscillospiraceae bacterium]|nr:M15 family metallopeptidase [Oscillospiraceae bacterium]